MIPAERGVEVHWCTPARPYELSIGRGAWEWKVRDVMKRALYKALLAFELDVEEPSPKGSALSVIGEYATAYERKPWHEARKTV